MTADGNGVQMLMSENKTDNDELYGKMYLARSCFEPLLSCLGAHLAPLV